MERHFGAGHPQIVHLTRCTGRSLGEPARQRCRPCWRKSPPGMATKVIPPSRRVVPGRGDTDCAAATVQQRKPHHEDTHPHELPWCRRAPAHLWHVETKQGSIPTPDGERPDHLNWCAVSRPVSCIDGLPKEGAVRSVLILFLVLTGIGSVSGCGDSAAKHADAAAEEAARPRRRPPSRRSASRRCGVTTTSPLSSHPQQAESGRHQSSRPSVWRPTGRCPGQCAWCFVTAGAGAGTATWCWRPATPTATKAAPSPSRWTARRRRG